MRCDLGIVALVVVITLAACQDREPPAPTKVPLRPATPAATGSTIEARDYIGPEACGECHAEQHALWSTSLHRVMNQRATEDAVIGDFDHAVTLYAGGEVRF